MMKFAIECFKILIDMHFVLVLLLVVSTGCSVYLAASQPDEKELSVLEPGNTRDQVISELGEPASSIELSRERTDTFNFEQGHTTGTKAGRAFFHLGMDLLTLGIWEIIATPTEMSMSSEKRLVEVTYDEEERVKTYAFIVFKKDQGQEGPDFDEY